MANTYDVLNLLKKLLTPSEGKEWIIEERNKYNCNKQLASECCEERAGRNRMCKNCFKVYTHLYYLKREHKYYKPRPIKMKIAKN